MASLVLWGASGHARVVADIVRLRGEHVIAGFLDDTGASAPGTPFCGATVLGGREQLPALRAQGVTHLLVAIGDGAVRLRLAAVAREHGFALAHAIHPAAVVAADVSVGAGTVIAAGAVVNPASRLGEHVIVNTLAGVDHDCVLGDGAHVAPGARLGGHVDVGALAWIGIGATVRDRVRVGDGTVVGAGAVVVSDLPGRVVAYGVPARIVREADR